MCGKERHETGAQEDGKELRDKKKKKRCRDKSRQKKISSWAAHQTFAESFDIKSQTEECRFPEKK